ncbi:MAG: type II toxin-antitoxin system PemK/MazF family toxin [Ignavibacteriales bacterium]|nr:type II toxin-antitoxin system PemK/MazF family toxin [Ignavibacteriales bacterium]
MTTFEPGQVVLVPFPFTDLITVKQRPALVISTASFNRQHADIIAIAITSQNPENLLSDEIALLNPDITSARLPKPSKVKTGKIVTIDQRLVRKSLGIITPTSLDLIMKSVHLNLHNPK